VSEPFALSHWPSPFSPGRRAFAWPCQSRAVTSFADVYPGDVAQAVLRLDAARARADHDRQLGLQVEGMSPAGRRIGSRSAVTALANIEKRTGRSGRSRPCSAM